MKLGLLHEIDGPQKATLREQPTYLSFTHKSLQEMEALKFVAQELETTKDIKVKFILITYLDAFQQFYCLFESEEFFRAYR